jgi:hypothetical protein
MADEKYTIKIYDYDYDSRERVYLQEVSASQVARCMTHENFVYLFDTFLNYGAKQYHEGLAVGKDLRNTHRTLQRSAIAFALGLIVGISDQEYTDARNGQAIETAKKIAEMYKNGELSVGMHI